VVAAAEAATATEATLHQQKTPRCGVFFVARE